MVRKQVTKGATEVIQGSVSFRGNVDRVISTLVIADPQADIEAVNLTRLAVQMTENQRFREGTELGLAHIEQGQYSTLKQVKRKLGDV